MQLEGQRDLEASVDDVRRALHDPDLLRRVVPRCQDLVPIGPDHFVVVLGLATSRLTETWRGMLTVQDTDQGLRLTLDVHGRGGRLTLDLRATLTALDGGRTGLRYTAQATLDGLAARAVTPSLDVLGRHVGGRILSELEGALRRASALV